MTVPSAARVDGDILRLLMKNRCSDQCIVLNDPPSTNKGLHLPWTRAEILVRTHSCSSVAAEDGHSGELSTTSVARLWSLEIALASSDSRNLLWW